jgi:uncharacterized protein YecT (DUF1311 family)
MRKPILCIVLSAIGLVGGATPLFAAGFDCGKAAAPMDYVICSSPRLQEANDALATAWHTARKTLDAAARKALVNDQRAWIHRVTAQCGLPGRGKPSAAVIAQAQDCVGAELEKRRTDLSTGTTQEERPAAPEVPPAPPPAPPPTPVTPPAPVAPPAPASTILTPDIAPVPAVAPAKPAARKPTVVPVSPPLPVPPASTPPTVPETTAAPTDEVTSLWSNGKAGIAKRVHAGGEVMDRHAAIEIQAQGRPIYLGEPSYLPDSVRLLWQRKGHRGPEAIVGGSTGGSHCGFDVLVLSLTNTPPVQTISVCAEQVPVITRNGLPSLTIALEVEEFTRQTDIPSVPVPLRWKDGRFAVDLPRLLKPAPSRRTLAQIAQRIGAELDGGVENYPPPDGGGLDLPATTQALMELMVAGHADLARNLLVEAWPARSRGRDAFWQDLATAVVNHRLWKQFDLARIPNSKALAVVARPDRSGPTR